jgi:gliding motility-associated-like protein
MKLIKKLVLSASVLACSSAFSQSDNCSFATTLSVTAGCTPVSGTTAGATASISGCVGNADDDVWYKFVATSTSHQITVTASASFDPVVQMFSGTCSTLTTLYCQDLGFNGGNENIYATGLTIGTTYTIRVYHYSAGSGSSTFTICVTTPPAPPSNNNCSGATPLTVNAACTNTASTSVGATQSSTGCAGPADDDVWFSFVATNSVQTITVDPSSSMDPVVQLYSGSCAALTSMYCMDNGFTNGNEVINAVGLTPGNTYFLRVYDYYTATGGAAFDICVTGTPTAVPTNDEPCSAIQLPAVTSACNYLNFTTTSATASTGTAPTPAACGGSSPFIGGFSATSHDVWFKITVPASGNIYITPQPGYGMNDAVMALYSGTCGALTQITCSDDYNYPGSANDFKPYLAGTGLTPGATVYLRYWGYGSTSGNFGICVSSPTNDACANALYICDINGYSASTSAAYTPDRPCNMVGNNENASGVDQPDGTNTGGIFGQGGAWGVGAPAYDVNINNNSWIRFTASATTAVLNVTIGNCWVGSYPSGGIQMQIFSGTNCCGFTPVSDFKENSTGFSITANGLTIGQSYYLMVDGFAGDICNYTITANSGVSFPAITASSTSICVGASPVTLTGPAGATSYEWLPGGQTTQSITDSPSTTTTYTCIAEGVCGYKQTLTKTVTVNPLPTVAINSGNPVSVCNNSSVTLSASGATSYSWSTGSTASSISVSPASVTTYTVTGTNSNGCTASITTNVNVLSQPTITVNSTSVCAGQPAVLTSGGASTTSSYSWSTGTSGTNTITVSPSSATNYTVTGTAANGCTNTAVASVSVNSLPSISVNSPSICNGQTATLNSSGASSTTNYSWSTGTSGINSINVSPSSATSYTVTGTGTNGCTNTAVANVTVNSLPNITVNSPSICSGQSATLTSGGAASATSYVWSTGTTNTNTITVSPSSLTSYTVTGTAANSCTNTSVATVTVNALPTISVNSPTICSGQTATLTSNGAGTPFSYVWSNGSSATNTINVSPSSLTTYTVTGAAGNGCTNTAVATVTVNAVPTISVNSATICNGQTAVLIANGASTGSAYSWSNGTNSINTISVSPASGTSYTVTGTGANSCTNTAVATVTVNALPAITVNSGTICNGQSIALTATSGNTYSWNTGASGPTINVSPTGNTSYTVTGTDGNSCSNTAVATVNVNNVPTLSSSPTITPSNCGQSTGAITGAIASGSGSISYSWTNSSNIVVGTSANLNAQPAGTYNLTVTDGNGCSSVFGPYNITNPGAPAAPTVTATDTIICVGESFTLNAFSNAPSPVFNWTGPVASSGTSTITISSAALTDDGTYSVTVTSSGCTSPPYIVNVTVNPLPLANAANAASSTYCSGATIDLVSSGGTQYSWNGPAGFSSTQQNPNIVSSTVTMSGTYSVTVTDANGCSSSATTTVTVDQTPPVPTASAVASNICEGQNISLSASSGGATSYNWTGPNGFSTTVQNPVITNASVIQSGIYSVTATSNGCTSSASTVNVTVNTNPVATAGISGSVVCSGTAINLTSSGGTGYSWTGPNGYTSGIQNPAITSADTTNSGTYIVTVSNAGGCSDTASISLLVNQTPPAPTAGANAANICEGDDIIFSASSTGATFYSWNGPNSFISGTQNPTIISAGVSATGTYTVIASAGSCFSSPATVNVTVNANPVATASVNSAVTCSGSTVNLSSTGGGTYNWTGPGGYTSVSQNPTFTSAVVNSGTYTVTVTNAAGCSDSTTVSLLVNQTPNAPIATSDTTCVGDPLLLTANGSGVINWYSDAALTILVASDTNAYVPVITTNTTATYYITSTDPNGCTSLVSTASASNYNVIASATASPTSGFIPLNVTFTNLSSGVDASDTYIWNSNGITFSNSYNPTNVFNTQGNYTITLIAIDAQSGCIDTTFLNIFADGNIFYTVPNIFTPNGDNTNDAFEVISHGITEVHVVIYDRWGLKMYEFDGVHASWDGRTTSGVEVPDGTYFYLFNAKDVNDKEYKEQGHVIIMR